MKKFRNKFKPINLFRLRQMKGQSFEAYDDQDRIGIHDGSLRLRKSSGSFKDYGKTLDIWLESFDNYAMIVISLFGTTAPDLHAALSLFKGDIIQLFRVYGWKDTVLPLAIEIHVHILWTLLT